MAETKKMLVAFDPTKPHAQSSDFLVPWNREGRRVFLGLKSGKDFAQGVMVFIGRSISENELFAKLVDTGASIGYVDETMTSLRSYLDQLQTLKIGNVVRITTADDQFGLELVAKTPSAIKA